MTEFSTAQQQLARLTQETTALLDSVLQLRSRMESSVNSASESASDAAESANSAADSLAHVVQLQQQLEALAQQAQSALETATAVVYGGGHSTAPTAGNVPVADENGKLHEGWLPADWSELEKVLALVISNTTDLLKLFAKDHADDQRFSGLDASIANMGELLETVRKLARENEHNLGLVSNDIETLSLINADQEAYMAEFIASQGQTGRINGRRYTRGGKYAYHRPVSGDYAVMEIHAHSDIKGIVGMAEGMSSADGRLIKRRHTDWSTVQTADGNYLSTEFINKKPTPSDVAALPPDQQAPKMREYYAAAAGKRSTAGLAEGLRPFKVLLAYEEVIEEWLTPELSDLIYNPRHQQDASTYRELLNKVQYFQESRFKNRLENIAYWHGIVKKVDAYGRPRVALRKSRVLGKEIGTLEDWPLHLILEGIDDLSVKYSYGWKYEQYINSRHGRFRVKQRFGMDDVETNFSQPEIIDQMMALIPGLDGPSANLIERYTQYGLNDTLTKYGTTTQLNAARYHRFYSIQNADASGRTNARFGWNDPSLWVAKTTRAEVSSVTVGADTIAKTIGMPLEIVVIPPEFNPYGAKEDPAGYDWATYHNNQSLGTTAETAMPGFFSKGRTYYGTSTDLYDDPAGSTSDPADTAAPFKWVKDATGTPRKYSPAGVDIFTPYIPGVGYFRTRYPIPYLYHEGSPNFAMSQALQREQESLLALEISNTTDILKLHHQLNVLRGN